MTLISERKTSSMVASNGLLAIALTNSVIHFSVVFAFSSFGISIDLRRTSLSFASISYKTSSNLMSFRRSYLVESSRFIANH